MLSPMDGCTGIPDQIAGISIRHCCDVHDEALFHSFDLGVLDKANVAFAHCVRGAGSWWFALPALLVVSTVGIALELVRGRNAETKNPQPKPGVLLVDSSERN